MRLNVELTRQELQQLLLEHLQEKFLCRDLKASDIHIETKSKQNYRSEWEEADFRARVNADV